MERLGAHNQFCRLVSPDGRNSGVRREQNWYRDFSCKQSWLGQFELDFIRDQLIRLAVGRRRRKHQGNPCGGRANSRSNSLSALFFEFRKRRDQHMPGDCKGAGIDFVECIVGGMPVRHFQVNDIRGRDIASEKWEVIIIN